MITQRKQAATMASAFVDRWPQLALTTDRAVETPWASVTFSGARHCLRFSSSKAISQGDLNQLFENLACEEFALPGHIVADIHVTEMVATGGGVSLSVEALTVEAA